MAEPFVFEKLFYDITDTDGLSAKETKTYDGSGYSGGTLYMTSNEITTASIGRSVAREITRIEIIPPQNSSGVYEDLRSVTLILDGGDFSKYIYLSGFGQMLITPLSQRLIGGQAFVVRFGVPMDELLTGSLAGKPNMALQATCPKYNNTFNLRVKSTYGTSSKASGGTGYRIRVFGKEYDDNILSVLYGKGAWNNTISLDPLSTQFVGGQGYAATFVEPTGGMSVATFNGYPSGAKQGGVKINPYWHKVTNALATSGSDAFVLSNEGQAQGASGHVADDFDDLGLVFLNTNNLLLVQGFGCRGVDLPPGEAGAPGVAGQNLTAVGWNIGGTQLPQNLGGKTGFFVSQNVNDRYFGDGEVAAGQAGRFFRAPMFPGKLAIYGVNAAPFIVGSASIPADQVAVAVTGPLVEAA